MPVKFGISYPPGTPYEVTQGEFLQQVRQLPGNPQNMDIPNWQIQRKMTSRNVQYLVNRERELMQVCTNTPNQGYVPAIAKSRLQGMRHGFDYVGQGVIQGYQAHIDSLRGNGLPPFRPSEVHGGFYTGKKDYPHKFPTEDLIIQVGAGVYWDEIQDRGRKFAKGDFIKSLLKPSTADDVRAFGRKALNGNIIHPGLTAHIDHMTGAGFELHEDQTERRAAVRHSLDQRTQEVALLLGDILGPVLKQTQSFTRLDRNQFPFGALIKEFNDDKSWYLKYHPDDIPMIVAKFRTFVFDRNQILDAKTLHTISDALRIHDDSFPTKGEIADDRQIQTVAHAFPDMKLNDVEVSWITSEDERVRGMAEGAIYNRFIRASKTNPVVMLFGSRKQVAGILGISLSRSGVIEHVCNFIEPMRIKMLESLHPARFMLYYEHDEDLIKGLRRSQMPYAERVEQLAQNARVQLAMSEGRLSDIDDEEFNRDAGDPIRILLDAKISVSTKPALFRSGWILFFDSYENTMEAINLPTWQNVRAREVLYTEWDRVLRTVQDPDITSFLVLHPEITADQLRQRVAASQGATEESIFQRFLNLHPHNTSGGATSSGTP